ncbi:unnamed protein product [Allacma fusca]|uniref:Uncharacterized protein n=1 Tax=Allacma fusca TaxID=39272 RepID=A0A8J2PU72_9HEXA|nr:unnamed protein product [Allacma fusca]
MKTFMAVTLLAAVAAAQQFNRPLTWMSPDLMKFQGPYAGQYYDNYGQAPLGYLGQQQHTKTPYMSQEIPLTPFSGLLSLDQIVKLPLFHEYLNIPIFKQYFPTMEFQRYIVSPMFQQYWTNPMFQQLFMDASMFYKHVFPLFHQYNTGKGYFEPAKDMLPPAPYYDTMPTYNTEAVQTPFSFDVLGQQQEVKKPGHPLLVYLLKKQPKIPVTLTVTDTPPAPLTQDVTNADMMDHILAEKIVKTIMSQYNHEGPAKKQDPNFRPEDVKLTYDSLIPEEEPAKKQDPNFRAEDVKLTYDSIIPTEPETVDKVPAVDVSLVSLTTPEPSTMNDMDKEEKALEILNAIKAKRFSRFEIPKKPTEANLIGAEEQDLNNLRYDVIPEETHRMVRQSPAYTTTGNDRLEVVPLSNDNSWVTYAGASGQEVPLQKSGDDDSFNLA